MTVADSMLVSSASVIVSEGSIGVAPSPSVKARVPAASETVGALLLPDVVSTVIDKLAPLEFKFPAASENELLATLITPSEVLSAVGVNVAL